MFAYVRSFSGTGSVSIGLKNGPTLTDTPRGYASEGPLSPLLTVCLAVIRPFQAKKQAGKGIFAGWNTDHDFLNGHFVPYCLALNYVIYE
jgi:hypothetical protein